MARADDTELIDRFEEFYRSYYRNEIGELAQKYPNEQKSLYVDWQDIYRFDPDLADDFRNKPQQLREYAEEALRLYDLPVDVSLGQAHVRVQDLPQTTDIREIRSDHRGMLIQVQGIVRKATDVRPKITTAAFECQRCGTLSRIPQDGDFQEPHECQGCERQGPFRINYDQSEFIDAQKLRVQESPEGLRGGETPQNIDVNIEDDITGEVTAGDHVSVSGILKLEQQGGDREKSPMFDIYMEGMTVEIEDEQFEEMDITDEDKKEIVELSNTPDIYERMEGAIAPSIYGFEMEKRAMIFQLFSGVTKFLPDESRTRGDLHILLVGDPGTGKCLKGNTKVRLADGNRKRIDEIVEENLDDPEPVDDGVYDTVDIPVPSLTDDGRITEKRATKVWKREAPDEMYRISTSSGRTLEVTPSHPLFAGTGGQFEPRKATRLQEGEVIAAAPNSSEAFTTDGGCAADGDTPGRTAPLQNERPWIGRVVSSDRIESIETIEPEYEWVYDLEIEGTHNYISEGIISHNSQLLQYVKNIAPRSVYTSGKGSSSAGLCVTGDTLIQTPEGKREIRTLVENELPEPVETETAVEDEIPVYTVDPEQGCCEVRETSRSWRMPNGQCRRIETRAGKQLEATLDTPVLLCGERGLDWRKISEVDTGDTVAVPEWETEPTEADSSVPVAVADGGSIEWEQVIEAENTGHKEVFDLTVPETHNFIGNGIVTHNTAAAVRDDFAEGQQWTLEAGALVLADQGIAAVDELDKMRCVTGDTLVHTSNGVTPIRELAETAKQSGEIEELTNGKTIRDVEPVVWTMTESGTIETRDVTAIHEYDAPDLLHEVTLESGESVTATSDHPFFVLADGERTTKPAADVGQGEWIYVPESVPPSATDGGSTTAETEYPIPDELPEQEADVTWRRVAQTEPTSPATDDAKHSKVYDLTVDGTHNFVANGIVIHNSEDQSAMHEALEQQSYHPDSEVLLADGRRVEIGEFVDGKAAANPDSVVDGVDCDILPVDDTRIHTVDLETNEVRKTDVDRVSRHEAPEEFVRVEFSNGRDVVVTPEHPMFVEDGGEVGTIEAQEVKEDAFVPAPRKLPNSAQPVELDGEPQVGTEKDVALPESLSPALGEILGFLVAEGHAYAGSTHEIGFSNQDERLLDRMDRLMGSVFGVESSDHTNAAGTVTKCWISTKLYRWFEENFPEVMQTARKKRIPAVVLGASEEVIRRFLVGAFAGDSGVESEAMSFSTASEGLARDYADALSKIGVASRIHHDSAEDSWKTYVMGDSTEGFVEQVVEPADPRHDAARAFVERSNETRRHHDVLPTSAAQEIRKLRRLLGLRLTGQFRPHLDEGYGVQVETVREEIATLRERIDDVRESLDESEEPGAVRAAAGWSARRLAEDLDGVTGNAISYAEAGGYDQGRRDALAERARVAVRDALATAERRIHALEARTDLRYYRVTDVETVPNEGEYECEWVYDVTVEPTNTFVSQGVVLHNSISVSKAGINATLKSRCSLLGAANPTYGRFDEYEPIGEQIDLAPPLISRFDLIFTVTDQPDEEKDAELAEHILQTNYAGELNTHREETSTSNYTREEVERVTEDVAPTIEPELLRKYVAYAKRNCYPTMTEEAKDEIQEYYVKLRSRGEAEDAPVPVTARKLEALVRLAEASARVRLSDTVEAEDAQRAIDIAQYCLEDIGLDPETGELDADMIETGTSKSQRDRIKSIKALIETIEEEYDEGAPVDVVVERAEEQGMEVSTAEHEIDKLKQKGEVYEPKTEHLRTT